VSSFFLSLRKRVKLMEISALTELDAVNNIIGTLGEAPINTLEDLTDVDAINALRILEEVSRQEQARGWSFNLIEDFVLNPDVNDNNRIPWNDKYLFVKGEEGTKLVRYGKHMKDLVRNSDYFPQPIHAEVILLIPFEELPEQMRDYIVAKAGFMFQAAYYGDDAMSTAINMQVQDAWQHLMDFEMDDNSYSMLDNEHVKELLAR